LRAPAGRLAELALDAHQRNRRITSKARIATAKAALADLVTDRSASDRRYTEEQKCKEEPPYARSRIRNGVQLGNR
jgi:hypothetical protein